MFLLNRTVFVAASARVEGAEDNVKRCFGLAGLDPQNPLAPFISPGQTVLLKPNLVKESHPRDAEGWHYTITSGELIRAVTDHVFAALNGRGSIIVGDGPQTDSSFEAICCLLGLHELEHRYTSRDANFRLIDLRREEWIARDGVIVSRRKLPGDPSGYVRFDLSGSSEFHDHSGAGSYYGADYDSAELNSHHSGGRHEYLISGTAIRADVVISLPKLKTHKKAGITAALKNLVGINGDKNWLPHHTEGFKGDGHPNPRARKHRLEREMVTRFRRLSLSIPGFGPLIHRIARAGGRHVFGDTEDVVRSGNWYGNDTIWRMCLDLNKILTYGNPDGTFREPLPENRKPHLVIVDGILAGEGRGPLNPDPVEAGLVLFGTNAASVDAACAVLMGFDPDLIPIVRNAFHTRAYPLAEWDWRDVRVVSNRPGWNRPLGEIDPDSALHFEPHFGWKNHIERTARTCCPR
jgi:uncharacterized protein (DUF362 family)